MLPENDSLPIYVFGIKEGKHGRFNESGRKQCGDWITGQLTTLCAPLRVFTTPRALNKRIPLHFKGVLYQMQENQGQGLLETKINLLLEKLYTWGMTINYDQPSQKL